MFYSLQEFTAIQNLIQGQIHLDHILNVPFCSNIDKLKAIRNMTARA